MDKKGEKPSFLSRRVVKTQLRNEWENVKLEEKMRQINRERFHKSYMFIKRTQEFNKVLTQIQSVKTRISVSPERRRFLKKHGYSIGVRDFEMDHLLNLLFEDDFLLADGTDDKDYNNPPKPPLIRLNDIMKAEEIELKRKLAAAEAEHDARLMDKRNGVSPKIAAPSIKPGAKVRSSKVVTQFRAIEPPKKGRELWKVRMDKEREAKEGLLTKDEEKELAEKVDQYRRRIVSRLDQRRRPATAHPLFPTSSSSNTTAILSLDTAEVTVSKPAAAAARRAKSAQHQHNINHSNSNDNVSMNNNKNDNNTDELGCNGLSSSIATEQLPILTITSACSEGGNPSTTKNNNEKSKQRPLSTATISNRRSNNKPKETYRRDIQSAGYNSSSAKSRMRKPVNDYSEMRLHFQGKTASLFVSKF